MWPDGITLLGCVCAVSCCCCRSMRKVIRRCCSCIEDGIESRKSCLSDLASVAGADMPNEARISASSVWLDDGGITLERRERKTRGSPVRCAMLNHALTQAWKCSEWTFENSQNTSVERGFIEALCVKVDRCRWWVWKTGAGCECDRQVQVVMVKCVIQQLSKLYRSPATDFWLAGR